MKAGGADNESILLDMLTYKGTAAPCTVPGYSTAMPICGLDDAMEHGQLLRVIWRAVQISVAVAAFIFVYIAPVKSLDAIPVVFSWVGLVAYALARFVLVYMSRNQPHESRQDTVVQGMCETTARSYRR